MSEEADKTKSYEVNLGVPLGDFQATVETLHQLCQEGKYQIFLSRGGIFRFVGEIDVFRVGLAKRLERDIIDRKRATLGLQEVKMYLQVCVAVATAAAAVKMIERAVFDDEFREAKEDQERTQKYREILQLKVDAVMSKLFSASFLERFKRLQSVVGPVLQDMDIEIISSRKSSSQDFDIDAPFLRIHLLHTTGSNRVYPFQLPPWVTDPPVDIQSFDLECDETDIDFLIRRLLQAKDILNTAIVAKVEASKALAPGAKD